MMNPVQSNSSLINQMPTSDKVDWDAFLSLDGMVDPMEIIQKNASLGLEAHKSLGSLSYPTFNHIGNNESSLYSARASDYIPHIGSSLLQEGSNSGLDSNFPSFEGPVGDGLNLSSNLSDHELATDAGASKSSRKRKVLTEAEREEKAKMRVMKNRKAAQESRDKKKAYIANLEESNRKLKAENDLLLKKVQSMEAQSQTLFSLMNQFSLNVMGAESASKLSQEYQSCTSPSKSLLPNSTDLSPFATPPWSPLPNSASSSSSPDLSEVSDHSLEDVSCDINGNFVLFPELPKDNLSSFAPAIPLSLSSDCLESHFVDSVLNNQLKSDIQGYSDLNMKPRPLVASDRGANVTKVGSLQDNHMVTSPSSSVEALMAPFVSIKDTRKDEDKKIHGNMSAILSSMSILALGPASRYLFESKNPISHSAFVRKEPKTAKAHSFDASLDSTRSNSSENRGTFNSSTRMYQNRFKPGCQRKSQAQFYSHRTVGRMVNMGLKLASLFIRGARKK